MSHSLCPTEVTLFMLIIQVVTTFMLMKFQGIPYVLLRLQTADNTIYIQTTTVVDTCYTCDTDFTLNATDFLCYSDTCNDTNCVLCS